MFSIKLCLETWYQLREKAKINMSWQSRIWYCCNTSLLKQGIVWCCRWFCYCGSGLQQSAPPPPSFIYFPKRYYGLFLFCFLTSLSTQELIFPRLCILSTRMKLFRKESEFEIRSGFSFKRNLGIIADIVVCSSVKSVLFLVPLYCGFCLLVFEPRPGAISLCSSCSYKCFWGGSIARWFGFVRNNRINQSVIQSNQPTNQSINQSCLSDNPLLSSWSSGVECNYYSQAWVLHSSLFVTRISLLISLSLP